MNPRLLTGLRQKDGMILLMGGRWQKTRPRNVFRLFQIAPRFHAVVFSLKPKILAQSSPFCVPWLWLMLPIAQIREETTACQRYVVDVTRKWQPNQNSTLPPPRVLGFAKPKNWLNWIRGMRKQSDESKIEPNQNATIHEENYLHRFRFMQWRYTHLKVKITCTISRNSRS